MLIEEFLTPMGITQKELTESIHVPYQRINKIINKKRGGGNPQHRTTVGEIFRYDGRLLDESTNTLGFIQSKEFRSQGIKND